MFSLVCPHCGDRCHFNHQWPDVSFATDGPVPSIFTCDGCGKPIAAMTEFSNDPEEYWIEEYWPTEPKKDFPDVPPQIAATASEAHICLGAGSPRGAVALARAVVESVAKDKGIHKGWLESKINDLRQKDLISSTMAEAAHEIRLAGNEAAHGDLVEEPLSIEDAKKIVALMDTILHRVYQEPADLVRIRERREDRKAKG